MVGLIAAADIPGPKALLAASDSLLVMIDLQERLLAAMPAEQRVRSIRAAGILAKAARQLHIPILCTRQYPRGLGEIDPSLRDSIGTQDEYIDKTAFSCCGVDRFEQGLEQAARAQVVISGVEAHVCVLQTVLPLLASGRQVFVVEDAVCSRDPAHAANAIQRMRSAGAVICNHESVLFEWLRDATHPKFKDLSALIR